MRTTCGKKAEKSSSVGEFGIVFAVQSSGESREDCPSRNTMGEVVLRFRAVCFCRHIRHHIDPNHILWVDFNHHQRTNFSSFVSTNRRERSVGHSNRGNRVRGERIRSSVRRGRSGGERPPQAESKIRMPPTSVPGGESRKGENPNGGAFG